jgi:hypothetical protein
MTELLERVLKAHGGLNRWQSFRSIEATFLVGGELLQRKFAESSHSQPPESEPVLMTVSTSGQVGSQTPFGGPGKRSRYSPNRVALETREGKILNERINPRDSFAGHNLDTPWDPLHLAYFVGYTQWIYLNAPFMLTLPGVSAEEIESLRHNDKTWRALKVTLPPDIASHSTVQTFYYGDDFLLRRQDYTLDIAGGSNVAHYTYDFQEADRMFVPTRRRAHLCDDDYNVLQDRVLIWINYLDVSFI